MYNYTYVNFNENSFWPKTRPNTPVLCRNVQQESSEVSMMEWTVLGREVVEDGKERRQKRGCWFGANWFIVSGCWGKKLKPGLHPRLRAYPFHKISSG